MKEIFRCVVGSTLYGLNGPGSDVDVKSVALPSAEDLLGMADTARGHWEQSEPSDTVVYSLTKFYALLAKGNPTVLELIAQIPSECVLHEDPLWASVRDFARKHFITKAILPAFFGYTKDQFVRVREHKAQNNRTEMIAKHGYDLKCSSHVYRLAVQAVEWMTLGMASPRMTGKDREVALDMKQGKYTYEQTIEILEIALRGMKAAESTCKLPEAPDMAAVNDFVTQIHRSVIVAG